MPCQWRHQVAELQTQIQQLDSRLSSAQLALRQAQSKAPSKSQLFTASLSSLDAPSQALQALQSTQKKARSERTKPANSKSVMSQGTSASDTVATSSQPAAQLGNDHAASQSGKPWLPIPNCMPAMLSLPKCQISMDKCGRKDLIPWHSSLNEGAVVLAFIFVMSSSSCNASSM